MPFLLVLPPERLNPTVNNIYGQGNHTRCVLLNTYLSKGLEIAELDGGTLGFQDFGGFREFGGGFELAGGVNNLGAAFAFGFRLAGDRALHLLGDVDLFDFDFTDLDAPRLGFRVENDLEFGINFVALGEDFVQFELADHAADGGLRELRGSVLIILHLGERQIGVDDAEIADRVHFHGDVVAGDDVLRRDVERFDAQAHARERFDGPEDEIQPGALGLRQHAAETQHHTAFPFLDDVQRIPEPNQHEPHDDQRAYSEEHEHVSSLFAPKENRACLPLLVETPEKILGHDLSCPTLAPRTALGRRCERRERACLPSAVGWKTPAIVRRG